MFLKKLDCCAKNKVFSMRLLFESKPTTTHSETTSPDAGPVSVVDKK
jgi:hypothetical protein